MVFQLTQKLVFPDPHYGEPDGLLAVGGDLNQPVKENQTPCFGECQKRIAVQRFATNRQGVKGIDQQ